LGPKAILAVFIHGTIELSVIVIAGCAGLILGNSLLFPKTFNRWVSLRKGGKDAVKIVLGLMPFFILAAFLEGFVTRHYKTLPLGINITILILSLLLIIWYFIIYPAKLHKRVELTDQKKPDGGAQNFQSWLNRKLNSEK
jgi:Stage II sporulation protein M